MNASRLALTIGIGVLLVGTVVLVRTRAQSPAQAVGEPLSVDHLAKNPAAYAEQVLTLEGVVAATVPEEKLFTVIDRAEYQACKVVTCSQYQVPIVFAGPLPRAEQLVMVTGRLIQPEPGRFLLEASRVEGVP
jgi:hypothetical protein